MFYFPNCFGYLLTIIIIAKITTTGSVRNQCVRGSLAVTDIGQKGEENRLKWLGLENSGEGKNAAKVVRAKTVEGKARRGRAKNTWERTIKKDLDLLSLTEELSGDRREGRLQIARPHSDDDEFNI